MTLPTDTPTLTPSTPTTAASNGNNNTKAVIALVLGILSMPCFCGFFAGIPAILLGHFELKAINEGKSPESNRTFAKVGFITGMIGTALTCLIAIVYGVIFGLALMNNGYKAPSTF